MNNNANENQVDGMTDLTNNNSNENELLFEGRGGSEYLNSRNGYANAHTFQTLRITTGTSTGCLVAQMVLLSVAKWELSMEVTARPSKEEIPGPEAASSITTETRMLCEGSPGHNLRVQSNSREAVDSEHLVICIRRP